MICGAAFAVAADAVAARRSEAGGRRTEDGESETNAVIARRLSWIAARSTCATVWRIMGRRRKPSRDRAPSSVLRPPLRSRDALREVLEARVLLDEGQLHGADRAVALLADDDLGRAFGFLVRVALGIAVLLFAEDEHDQIRILFE